MACRDSESHLGAAVLLVCLIALPARAQEREIVPFEGTQAFAQLLNFFQLQPLPSVAAFRKCRPEETLLVVFGDTSVLDSIGKLARFRDNGGAILVASDRHSFGRLRDFDVVITGQKVYEAERTAYKNQPHYPWILQSKRHPVFDEVANLAANAPSFLSHWTNPPEMIGEFSDRCFLVDGIGLRRSAFMRGTPGWRTDERLLLLAGHSVFMNGLLGQDDNHNFRFAYNCVRWLSQKRDGRQRRQVLFVVDDVIVDSFDMPLTVPQAPPLPPIATVNRLLQKLEEENFFYRIIYGDDNWNGLFDPEMVVRAILLLLSLVLLIWGAGRLATSVSKPDTAAPLPQTVAQQAQSRSPVIVQRTSELRRLGNYQEAAHQLARQFIEQFPELDEALSATHWWTRRRLARNLRQVRDLAEGRPLHVNAAGLRRLLRHMDELARTTHG